MTTRQFRTTIAAAAIVMLSSPVLLRADQPPQPPPDGRSYIISLKDFTAEEVKGLGFTLTEDLSVHINAVGGGTKSMWDNDRGRKSGSNDMYAYGWIIDADTREVVWEMSMSNTSGREEERTTEDEVTLKRGSYEVYFAAHGFAKSSGLSFYSNNIDRRSGDKGTGNEFVEKFLGWFDDDYKDLYRTFMRRAKETWGIFLSVPKGRDGSVKTFNAPKKPAGLVYAATGVGDGAYVRKTLTVSRDVTLDVYAVGEGRGKGEMFDYGWITNSATRERVWEMTFANTMNAGGASKNLLFRKEVRLTKGAYELNFVTDDSHSRDDWNSSPPYDPFNYGVSLIAKNDADRSAVSVTERSGERKNVIVQLVKVRDDEYRQAGFTLKEETQLHIYALGEGTGPFRVRVMGKPVYEDDRFRMADYGWIVNARTRERVWEMRGERTEHAGGASKNRLADEFITLPKGDYIVYYQTDDSHAYNDWNDDKPYDADAYGITVMGAGENFSMKNVAAFDEAAGENVLVQLVRVRDGKHVRQKFTVDKSGRYRVYAIGEGVDRTMADYGWIENAKNGETVWEMTYRTTMHAGGSSKNRLYDREVFLEKGEYELHYQTDDSHAFNDWNDDPPDDRSHYGITVYKAP